jgi:hypothetical protein
MVEDIAATDQVVVLINGDAVGQIALDKTGAGLLDLNTESGDDVPQLQDGDEVDVVDAYDGTVLLTGILHRVR